MLLQHADRNDSLGAVSGGLPSKPLPVKQQQQLTLQVQQQKQQQHNCGSGLEITDSRIRNTNVQDSDLHKKQNVEGGDVHCTGGGVQRPNQHIQVLGDRTLLRKQVVRMTDRQTDR